MLTDNGEGLSTSCTRVGDSEDGPSRDDFADMPALVRDDEFSSDDDDEFPSAGTPMRVRVAEADAPTRRLAAMVLASLSTPGSSRVQSSWVGYSLPITSSSNRLLTSLRRRSPVVQQTLKREPARCSSFLERGILASRNRRSSRIVVETISLLMSCPSQNPVNSLHDLVCMHRLITGRVPDIPVVRLIQNTLLQIAIKLQLGMV